MIISHQNAVRYANALYSIEGSGEEIRRREKEMNLLGNVMASHPEILTLLNDPELTTEKKIEVTETALNIQFDPVVKRLIALLVKRHYAGAIRQVAAEYYKLVIKSLKEIIVEVTYAQTLSDKKKKQLQSQLERKLGKKCHLMEKTDPTLLGGFTVLFQDQFLDLSIKGKLMQLKKQLLKAKI